MLSRKKNEAGKFDEYLTVAQAAEVIGVSPSTLRNWDRTGKLKAARHPVNDYRLYRREDLEGLLRQARIARDG